MLRLYGLCCTFQVLSGGIELTEDISIDWIGKNMYWTDYALETVEVATVEGKHRKVLFSENVDNPRALALDPREGSVKFNNQIQFSFVPHQSA